MVPGVSACTAASVDAAVQALEAGYYLNHLLGTAPRECHARAAVAVVVDDGAALAEMLGFQPHRGAHRAQAAGHAHHVGGGEAGERGSERGAAPQNALRLI